jgi:regulation of enolase protein 1 (concanavalin A-like superfamily)
MTAEGRTKTRRSFLCPAVLALLSVVLTPCSRSPGATLQTLDAKTYEGEIKLEKQGQIVVTAADEKPHRFDLSEVLHVTFGPDSPVAAIPAAARTENGQILAPWRAFDVGRLAQKGYARFNGDVFSVKSAGGTIGEDRDAFCFVAQPLSGDGEIVARFMTVNDPRHVVQGLMIRSSADPGATFAAIFCVEGDMRFFTRTRPNGATDAGTVGAHKSTLPFWARLTRKGDELLASFSQDGKSWERVGRETISMRAQTLAGIATCGKSHQLQGGHVTAVRLTAATLAAPPPLPLKQGLLLRSGTFLAGARIEKADDASLRFGHADRHDNLPLAQVARVVFRDLSPEALAAIPPRTTGLLLKEGDFVEGDFKGMRDGRLLISSVLFGLARFEPDHKAVALVLNDLDPAHSQMILRTHDGSVYFADSVTPEKDKLIIEDPAAGEFSVNRWDVTEISLGSGRTQSLAALRPAKIVTPTPGQGYRVDPTGSDPRTALPGVAVEHALTLAPNTAATWNLAGAYRTFTFTAAVPRSASHTARLRFTVVGDDKELYKSPPQTSLDAPRLTSVSVKGVRALTLKVESADKNVPTPGLFANPSLIK